MKILVGMPQQGSWGGPGACEPPLTEGLRQFGVEVDEEVYVYGDKLRGTKPWDRVARVVRTALRLRRRLKAQRYDLIHLNTSFDTKAVLRDTATLCLLPGNARVFLKMHGSDTALLRTNNRALDFLARRLIKKVAGLGVLSAEEKENFIRAGYDAGKVFVVSNTIGRPHFRTDSEFARRHDLADGEPVVLFIARFIPAKGLLDVIRACAIVRDSGRTFTLLCLGDGPARAEAETEAARLNLSTRVRFFGYLPEAETVDFYANSSMLVFPTYHQEGLPLVVLYSVAAGLPIITTRIRGAADHLQEPDNCLWVAPRDPHELAEKITRLLDHPELQQQMKYNNQQLAHRFSPPQVAAQHLQIYKKVLRTEY